VTLEDYATERIHGQSRSTGLAQPGLPSSDDSGTLVKLGRRFARTVLGVASAPPDGVEHYRRLAALMYEAQVERAIKTLVVTSAVPREGKTTTICNLAAALSESYQRRVLLIDADLRRPSVHEVFSIANENGLVDALHSEGTTTGLVSVSPRLSILPAGVTGHNPLAGLSSSRMAAVVREAGREFDWVLLDTPPVGLLPDAQHVTRIADAVLLVIAAGVTPYNLVQRAVGELGADRILGTILNRVQQEAIPMTSYYRQYYGSADSSNG
jgi:capsular exopolysaccharide synthesis family protein